MTFSESTEIDISALVDGEFDREKLLPLIDQLVEREELREFYRSARRLEGAVSFASAPEPAAPPVPERIWRAIRQRSDLVPSRAFRGVKLPSWTPSWAPAWAIATAAVCLVVLTLWDSPPNQNSSQTGRIRPGLRIELDVGADPDHMSDERFVTLTTELLRADSRYHRKMLQVMSEVDRVGFQAEGSTDGRVTFTEGSRGERSRTESAAALP